MNTRYNMIIIKGEIKTPDIISCMYNSYTKKMDTYVYMGGNDVATAIEVSKRCDLPMKKILNMPVGTSWIFRRGEPAVFCNNFDIDRMLFEKGLLIRYNSNVERRI